MRKTLLSLATIALMAIGLPAAAGAAHASVAGNTLPAFSFITPDLIDDMHDGTIADGDTWLASNLPTILNSPEYQSGSTAVFITWDEGSGGKTGESCAANTTDACWPDRRPPGESERYDPGTTRRGWRAGTYRPGAIGTRAGPPQTPCQVKVGWRVICWVRSRLRMLA